MYTNHENTRYYRDETEKYQNSSFKRVRQINSYQIAPEEGNGIPERCKSYPAGIETEGEDEQDIPPLDVQHRVEEVSNVTPPAFGNMGPLDSHKT